jgi:hypothetical protein
LVNYRLEAGKAGKSKWQQGKAGPRFSPGVKTKRGLRVTPTLNPRLKPRAETSSARYEEAHFYVSDWRSNIKVLGLTKKEDDMAKTKPKVEEKTTLFWPR